MTQVNKLKAAGFTGKGIKIGLVDTGIDYTHPALGGCFGPGCIVSYGRDYVGDYYDEYAEAKPAPDDDPYDGCNGHGTHTAGIIAAQKNPFGFTGVAPGVQLGAYRVTSCRGNVHEDIYLKGFNDAFEAGSDIISTSTLFNSDWKEDPAAILLSRIVKQGIPCIVPMGNSGQMGLFSTGSPAVATGVTAVGSVINLEYPMMLKKAQWSIGENGAKKEFGWAEGHFGNFGDTVKPLVYIPDAKDKSCEHYPGPNTPDLYGYVVLVDPDGCPLYNKTNVLMDYGARDIMVISSDFT
jgi:subtilisin family serine protease